jgi:hypothetical protein
MRPKQTAEAAARGAVVDRGTGPRRRLSKSLYAAFLLFAAFSVSGVTCIGDSPDGALANANAAVQKFADLLASVQSELASPTPDLMKIGVGINEMESDREALIVQAQGDLSDNLFHAEYPNNWAEVMTAKTTAEGAWKDQIAALTDQFDRLGGWGVANAQHQVLTSGGTWNWVTLGTNPDLNPGGPTFTGASPGGGSGCPVGETFIIGVGCVH